MSHSWVRNCVRIYWIYINWTVDTKSTKQAADHLNYIILLTLMTAICTLAAMLTVFWALGIELDHFWFPVLYGRFINVNFSYLYPISHSSALWWLTTQLLLLFIPDTVATYGDWKHIYFYCFHLTELRPLVTAITYIISVQTCHNCALWWLTTQSLLLLTTDTTAPSGDWQRNYC